MAKKSRQQTLAGTLRADGIRKGAGRLLGQVTDGRRKPAKRAKGVVGGLGHLLEQAQDRISGGPAKRKAAAQKAAASRRRNALKRSSAAKKGARTRAKSRA